MADPTGRWLNTTRWQCPKCGWVNDSDRERCQKCGGSVRPSASEPVRPPDPLDLISYDETRVADGTAVERAAKAVHRLSRVTREKAMDVIGDSLRAALTRRGEKGDRAWQAIRELPEDAQRAALGSLVDDLAGEGFALYRIDDGDESARE
jgi:hypothetical protein